MTGEEKTLESKGILLPAHAGMNRRLRGPAPCGAGPFFWERWALDPARPLPHLSLREIPGATQEVGMTRRRVTETAGTGDVLAGLNSDDKRTALEAIRAKLAAA